MLCFHYNNGRTNLPHCCAYIVCLSVCLSCSSANFQLFLQVLMQETAVRAFLRPCTAVSVFQLSVCLSVWWNVLTNPLYCTAWCRCSQDNDLLCNTIMATLQNSEVIFYTSIHGSVHRNCILIRSNKMQQYTGIYLLQNYCTCFGCSSHPSSGVHKTVTAASGTGHSIWATTFLQRGL